MGNYFWNTEEHEEKTIYLLVIYDIVSNIVKNVSKPVTVKIRSGFDKEHINAVEICFRGNGDKGTLQKIVKRDSNDD